MTLIHFVRHGVHDQLQGRLCGRTPGILMGPAGLAQARRLAERFERADIDAVVSSPLERTIQTAEPIAAACGVPLAIEPALIEIDFGSWTGARFDDLDPDEHWRGWNAGRDQVRAPGGETMLEVQQRIARWLEDLPRRGARTLVAVSHADVIKAAVAFALGLSLRDHDRFEIAPASITVLRVEPGSARLVSLNGDCS
ncbi:hypothetical protein ASG43_18250 [Aureimonas sp. Leaf454]|uniref:histidine phosphatase family protein n=1 Tax=Aureimonas sp. Leaf454 TaxID=1736381 RepID=UPI0006F52D40|nr:histidine phosphatase family protein [Aureimonas sp. Leaf454]KQT53768.1 hypothetical protein ASG43_18250 [Aureimonas sp. Leaf454]